MWIGELYVWRIEIRVKKSHCHASKKNNGNGTNTIPLRGGRRRRNAVGPRLHFRRRRRRRRHRSLTCLRGALPPVDLRAVCLVRAMVTSCDGAVKLDGFVSELFFGRKIMRQKRSEEVVETTRRVRLW